jgi:hypothetical protein
VLGAGRCFAASSDVFVGAEDLYFCETAGGQVPGSNFDAQFVGENLRNVDRRCQFTVGLPGNRKVRLSPDLFALRKQDQIAGSRAAIA